MNVIEEIKRDLNEQLDRLERQAEKKLGKSTVQEYWDRSGKINAFGYVLEQIESLEYETEYYGSDRD